MLLALFLRDLPVNASTKWIQNAITVAGGNGCGNGINQLAEPWGICVDENRTVYVTDFRNHCVVQWKYGAIAGELIAGGHGCGNGVNQLYSPTHAIIDKERDCLLISDWDNKRLIQWPLHNGRQGQTILSNIGCCGLAMDDDGNLYVCDFDKHEVKRYRIGENEGTVVAGGNGAGSELHQLDWPRRVFVDAEDSVYVSDTYNHRVVKWIKGAKEGIIVAGGNGLGYSLKHLSSPNGIFVDQSGALYVADEGNHRIMRWTKDATQGSIIVGGNGQGNQPNQLHHPMGLTFDREGDLYVSDKDNYRVQRFIRERS